MRQSIDVNGHSRRLLSTTKILRLFSLILVGLSFVNIHLYDVRQIGGVMRWKSGDTYISSASHPAVVLWAAAAVALFVLLMVSRPSRATGGVPTLKRRVLAYLIDFWFSLLIVSSVGELVPLLLEAKRTGHFAWHFQRNYSVSSDGLAASVSLVFMALMVLYFAFPLTRGRQTVGYFILRLRVAPPFGDEGRFTVKAAIMRTYYAFVGLASVLTRNWDRDEQGRTWYDRKTNCTVILVEDD